MPYFRDRHNPDRIVNAVHYDKDASNAAYVCGFLNYTVSDGNPWRMPRTRFCGPDYKTIALDRKNQHPLYIAPGNVVYLDVATKKFSVLPYHAFFQHYDKIEPNEPTESPKESEMTAPTMTEPAKYIRCTDNAAATAIRYVGLANIHPVLKMLHPYVTELSYDGNASIGYQINPNKVDSARSGTIIPDVWIVLIERPEDLPLMTFIHTDAYFEAYFKPASAEQDTPVTTPLSVKNFSCLIDPDSEYGQNVIEVLDALAVLRNNPSDAHFELATREIMGLLAEAYNKGWSEGISTALRNPYDPSAD